MRLVVVDLNAEPDCLRELKASGQRYVDLVGACKDQVELLLSNDQHSVCAYCEQTFKSKVFIEHYFSRTHNPERDLDYDNFLGICSGKHYTDKFTGAHISHCGDSRGGRPLRIDPRNVEHIEQVYFEDSAAIRSHHQDHDHDLNTILNLNFELLRNRRNQEYLNSFSNFIQTADHLNIQKKEVYLRAIRILESGTYEFAGYLIFRYRALLAAMNTIEQ